MGKLPGDACPYPRPFPEGFSECAVFEEVALRHRRSIATPEMKLVSCRNLTVGTFARDTRFVSGYSLTINGRVPLLLDASPFDHFSARWEFTSPELPLAGTLDGAEHDVILEERAIGIRLDRTILEGIHEDYDL